MCNKADSDVTSPPDLINLIYFTTTEIVKCFNCTVQGNQGKTVEQGKVETRQEKNQYFFPV